MDFILINRLNALYKKNYNEELNPKIINTLKRILLLQFDLNDLKGLDISIGSNFVSSNCTPLSTSKISLDNLYGNFFVLEIDNKQGSCYLYSEHSISVKRQGSDEVDRIPFLEIKFDGAEEKPVIFTFLSNGHLIRQTFSVVESGSDNLLFTSICSKDVYIYDFEIYCDANLVRGREIVLSDAQPEFFGKYSSLDFYNPNNNYFSQRQAYKEIYKFILVCCDNQVSDLKLCIGEDIDDPTTRCLLSGVQIVDSLVPKSRVPGSSNDYTLTRSPN